MLPRRNVHDVLLSEKRKFKNNMYSMTLCLFEHNKQTNIENSLEEHIKNY